MSKNIKLSALLIALGVSVFTLEAYNPRGNVSLNRILSQSSKKTNALKKGIVEIHDYNVIDEIVDDDNAFTHYPVIIELKENASQVLDDLEAVVFHSRNNLYLTCIPIENLDKLPREVRIDNFQISTLSVPNLDIARQLSQVDLVHHKMSIFDAIPFDSDHKVVTGICDAGFDPAHTVFKDCLKQWVIYDEFKAQRQLYHGYQTILNEAPESDDKTMTHATHVANILAGYNSETPYYGVAPATDFVCTTSKLTEVGICSGIEDIIEYAKQTGRPAVVNISAGSYLGPHDGKDLVGRYLSALAEDAVICFSAGNYGQRANCQSLDLDIYSSPVGCTICDTSWTGFTVSGGTDFWSRDDKAFEFRLVIWDTNKREYKYVTDWFGSKESEGEYYLDLEQTPWFTSGGVWLSWGTYESNNRFNVALEYDYTTEAQQTAGPWANFVLSYQVRKISDNTHVDIYADGIRSFLHNAFGLEGGVRANPDGSISNLACCPDVVAVGAWNSRTLFPDIETGTRDWGNPTMCIAPWSAYGTSGDGRKLPHFAAPGNALISALSSYYPSTDGTKSDGEHIAAEINGYLYFAEAGTSMASPFAAGVFALWLHEYPELNVHQLTDIAMKTAQSNFNDISDPRWGAGGIDALRGWNEVCELKKGNGVNNVCPDYVQRPSIMFQNGHFHVMWPGVNNFNLSISDISGKLINNQNLKKGGIYILQIEDAENGTEFVTKVVI